MAGQTLYLETQVIAHESAEVFALRIDEATLSAVLDQGISAGDMIAVVDGAQDYFPCQVVEVSPDGLRDELLQCVVEKNLHGIRRICAANGKSENAAEPLCRLLSLYGTPKSVMPKIRALAEDNGAAEYAEELSQAAAAFAGSEAESRIRIDFSASGDVKYYNGIAFKGFISGIPGSVLSGGQYDRLMRRMGRKDRAIGFAVFMNMLERLKEGGRTDD